MGIRTATETMLVARSLVLVAALFAAGADAAELRATALFADGAVLQTADGGGAGARITGTVSGALWVRSDEQRANQRSIYRRAQSRLQ
jgi:hypothetical protein